MKEKKDRVQINIRITPEEKEMIDKKVKENKTTITALVLNSIENNITVNLDTSDYRDLVIQFRRIGNNINGILKRVHFRARQLMQVAREFTDRSSLSDLGQTKVFSLLALPMEEHSMPVSSPIEQATPSDT